MYIIYNVLCQFKVQGTVSQTNKRANVKLLGFHSLHVHYITITRWCRPNTDAGETRPGCHTSWLSYRHTRGRCNVMVTSDGAPDILLTLRRSSCWWHTTSRWEDIMLIVLVRVILYVGIAFVLKAFRLLFKGRCFGLSQFFANWLKLRGSGFQMSKRSVGFGCHA